MHRITKIGILSMAKVTGLTGALIGLIIGVIYGLVIILASVIGGAAASADPEVGTAGWGMAGMGVLGGVMVMVMVPVFYGGMLFVMGLIYGLVINVVLSWTGGFEVQIQAPVTRTQLNSPA
jgi:hypothetical protein